MKRKIYDHLVQWKCSTVRKPLIIKGVRQVGKTTILKKFGEEQFPQCHYYNFEKRPELASIFSTNLDPERIVNELSLRQKTKINRGKDLVIFDEIQACPNALTSLKYFCEDMPDLHVCCAGSLLGVYLGPVSYPVGKVDKMQMFPMSFTEFLNAIGDEVSAELIEKADSSLVFSEYLHGHLWEQLKKYFIIGGLPEVVAVYRRFMEDPATSFDAVRRKQNELIDDYYADIAKHSGKVNSMQIGRVLQSVPEQLARSQEGSAPKYRFKGVVPGVDRYSQLVGAIDWLECAGLVMKTHIVNHGRLPLQAYVKENSFKLYVFDVGILGALSELDPVSILDYNYASYKGFFAENYVAQAFLLAGVEKLYCWQGKTAEVEFLRQHRNQTIPIEVKSGVTTQAKSLRVFTEKFHPPYRVIISAKNLSIDEATGVHNYPLYLADRFPL